MSRRNPFLGQGLDKRQARRARRRAGQLGRWIEHATGDRLAPWQIRLLLDLTYMPRGKRP